MLAIALLGIALAAPARAQPQTGQAAPGSTAPALPQTLPLRRDAPATGESGSWLPAALLVAVITAGGALVLRRRGLAGWAQLRKGASATRGGGIARLSSQALTAQASVHAVRWGSEEILLGCTAHAVTVLARRPLPLPSPEVERP